MEKNKSTTEILVIALISVCIVGTVLEKIALKFESSITRALVFCVPATLMCLSLEFLYGKIKKFIISTQKERNM